MSYIYLFLAMTFSALITVGSRFYNSKNQNISHVSALYSLLTASFSALSWLILWCTDFSFDLKVLPYSFFYGAGYTFFTVGMLGAIKTGSTSLTGLIKQLALVGVSFWGVFFWDTRFTTRSAIGILLLILSLALCLLVKEKKTDTHHFGKWLFYCALITVGNAGCSIIQRYQQLAFDYQHKNMFMFFGLSFAALFCLIPTLVRDRAHGKAAFRRAWMFPALAGSSSAFSNLFILLLVKREMSPVILYPGVAVGGLMLTTLIAVFFFREKLRRRQWAGLCIGALALIFLNL